MVKEKHLFLRLCIEIQGWLGLILIFASIWIDNFRWKLLFTGILVWIMCLLNYAVYADKKKKETHKSQKENQNA